MDAEAIPDSRANTCSEMHPLGNPPRDPRPATLMHVSHFSRLLRWHTAELCGNSAVQKCQLLKNSLTYCIADELRQHLLDKV